MKRRHRGYLIVLVVEIILLLTLPLAQHYPWLLSVMLISLCLALIGFVSRFSMLRHSRPLVYGLGGLAVVMEILWHLNLRFMPQVGQALTIPHMIAWLAFLMLTLLRKVKTLINEPYVTSLVVMGAASGYLLVGVAGGVMLTALVALSPHSFVLASPALARLGAQHVDQSAIAAVVDAPALVASSFNMLTTVGSAVVTPTDVLGSVAVTVITVSGQLYVAILIALILGRFHKRQR